MRASEFNAALQRCMAGACVAAVSFSSLPPLSIAAELAAANSQAQPARAAEGLIAQKRSKKERAARARYRRGSAAGALTRPAPGFDRGNRRPSGGWVQSVPPGSLKPYRRPLRPRPGMGGSTFDRPRPNWSRPGWKRPNWALNRPIQINNIHSRPRWWGPRWSSSRPWRAGWYNRGYNRWNWWNNASSAWGITSLAGAAIIGAAINNALKENKPTIEVSNSPYQLVYGSVSAVDNDNVTFNFLFGDTSYEARSNCKQGTLNGLKPDNPEEAQLMNAACEVAFGTF